jgi:hypothetical protein
MQRSGGQRVSHYGATAGPRRDYRENTSAGVGGTERRFPSRFTKQIDAALVLVRLVFRNWVFLGLVLAGRLRMRRLREEHEPDILAGSRPEVRQCSGRYALSMSLSSSQGLVGLLNEIYCVSHPYSDFDTRHPQQLSIFSTLFNASPCSFNLYGLCFNEYSFSLFYSTGLDSSILILYPTFFRETAWLAIF